METLASLRRLTVDLDFPLDRLASGLVRLNVRDRYCRADKSAG
jgi:hypothetical protein